MHSYFRCFTTAIFLFLVYCSAASSATITAASCSASDVQAAINSANPGDTIVIPPGECTWTSQVTVDKAITLHGSGIDSTVIHDENTDHEGLVLITKGDKYYRVTNMTWIESLSGNVFSSIRITGDSSNVRLDHMKIVNNTRRSIKISGAVTGVIDHCQFECATWGDAIYVSHANWGVMWFNFNGHSAKSS